MIKTRPSYFRHDPSQSLRPQATQCNRVVTVIIQTDEQRIGAEGENWVIAAISSHQNPPWIARKLSEDYGVDAEAELTLGGVRGEILKLQIKTSAKVPRDKDSVRFDIDRRYVDYAMSCRYPVIFVRVDNSEKQAWYLWLQEWALIDGADFNKPTNKKQTCTVWVDGSQTLASGLNSHLADIASWRGKTQLALSLRDAMRAAAATFNPQLVRQIVALVSDAAPIMGSAFLDLILRDAISLGNNLKGTIEGNAVGDQLFALVRTFGDRVTLETIDVMVRREDSYSRTGLIGLGILYDEFVEHTSSLGLVNHFLGHDLPHVAYYCALRESHPGKGYWDFLNGPGEFEFAGLKFTPPTSSNFSDKYANRGPSAILDYLESA